MDARYESPSGPPKLLALVGRNCRFGMLVIRSHSTNSSRCCSPLEGVSIDRTNIRLASPPHLHSLGRNVRNSCPVICTS